MARNLRCDACGYRKATSSIVQNAVLCSDCLSNVTKTHIEINKILKNAGQKTNTLLQTAKKLFEDNSHTYLFQGIPKGLFDRFKHKVISEGGTIKDRLLDLMEEYTLK